MLACLFVAAAAWQTMLIFTSVRQGTPFSRRNVSRVTLIAITMLVGGSVWKAADFASSGYLAAQAVASFGSAEFFRRDVKLSDDAEGLV